MNIGHLSAEISRLHSQEMAIRGNDKDRQVRPAGRPKRSLPRGAPPGGKPSK